MKCSFCEGNIEPGTGKTFIKKDGKILHFCKMKCEKNMRKLKRRARTLKWTTISRAEKKKHAPKGDSNES